MGVIALIAVVTLSIGVYLEVTEPSYDKEPGIRLVALPLLTTFIAAFVMLVGNWIVGAPGYDVTERKVEQVNEQYFITADSGYTVLVEDEFLQLPPPTTIKLEDRDDALLVTKDDYAEFGFFRFYLPENDPKHELLIPKD